MTRDVYSALLRSVLKTMSAVARAVHPEGRIKFIGNEDGFTIVVDLGHGLARYFCDETINGVIERAKAFLAEQEADRVAETLGLEPATSTQSA